MVFKMTRLLISWKLYRLLLLSLCVSANVFADLPDIIQQIKPSIVGIGTYQPTRAPQSKFLGTGFVVGDGQHIITNAHVLPEVLDTENNEILAILIPAEGNRASGRQVSIVAQDKDHDLALLKISGARLSALQLDTERRIREGETYAFTGFPIGAILGLKPVTHQGIISAITPIVEPAKSSKALTAAIIRRQKEPYNVYQLDATAYPGNSGSPLYDLKTGKVVAVINSVFVKTTKENVLKDPSGITYAIPAKYVEALIEKAKSAR